MTTQEDALTLVTAFHEAVNAGDADRLSTLVTEDVEVGGPRGSGRGAGLVREWVGRAGIQLTARRFFARDAVVVVEGDATWRDPQTGASLGSQPAATVFRVRDGRIASVVRLDRLDAALGAAGLEGSDEVAGAGGEVFRVVHEARPQATWGGYQAQVRA